MRTAHWAVLLLAVAVSSPWQARAVVLLDEDFSGAGIDPTTWVVHGAQATSGGDSLQIIALGAWTQGIESSLVFARPSADSMIVISGRARLPETNWECVAGVWLQPSWGGSASDCYGVDFDLDQIYLAGDNVCFEARLTGQTTTRTTTGLFPSDAWFEWRLEVFDEGCEVYCSEGSELAWQHTCQTGSFPFRLILTSYGSTAGPACLAFFDDVLVTREPRITKPHFTACPRAGFAGLAVTFENETTAPVTTWDWDFGDNTVHSAEEEPTHTYDEVGEHAVTLTAIGPLGSGVDVKTGYVTVFEEFADDFAGPDVDRGKWIVHGERVTSPEDSLEIVYRYAWEQGVESIARYTRPVEGERITISGTFEFTEGSAPGTAVVHLRDGWAGLGDRYFLRFRKDVAYTGDGRVEFGGAVGGVDLALREVDRFETGDLVRWRVDLLPQGCDIFIDDGGGWEWRDCCEDGGGRQAIVIEGADARMSPTTVAYWDDIHVVMEAQSVACQYQVSNGTGPAPLAVTFTDHSRGDIDSWEWDFGDSSAHSFDASPTHTYDVGGVYNVTLTVSGPGGQDSETRIGCVVVSEVASFTANPGSGAAPLTAQFIDASSAGTWSWDWDFGDGSAHSSEENPQHVYGAPGEYTVTLNVDGPSGGGSMTRPDYITARSRWTTYSSGPLGDPGPSRGASWIDYDSDGDDDIYVANSGAANRLLRNDGGAVFTNVATGPLADSGPTRCGAWGDFDNDRDLDVYLVNYDAACRLLRNDGGDTFTEVTTGPLANTGPNTWAGWADYDNDGDLDLYTTSWAASNHLFRNDGGGTFVDATPTVLAVNDITQSANWADYDNDGDQDLYVLMRWSANRLFRNDGGTFVDVTEPPLNNQAINWSGIWGDYDNDGDLDLYVTTAAANVLMRNDGGVFEDATTWPLSLSYQNLGAAWGDCDNDGDLDVYLGTWGHYNALFRNDGDEGFRDITVPPIDDIHYTRGVSWGDYDSDGDLDLYVADGEGSILVNKLFSNDTPWGNHWLRVDLAGTVSNTFGVGARIRAVTGSAVQMRHVGGDAGYVSQNSLTAEFGLGAAVMVDTLEVFWPSGLISRLTGVGCDQRLVVWEQGDGPPAAPQGLAGSPGSEAASAWLLWHPNSEADLDHYVVQRDTTNAFGGSTVSVVASDTTHVDTGLEPWQEYFYRVIAVDAYSLSSDPSDAVSVVALPTGIGEEPSGSVRFDGPNPFGATTALVYSVASPGTPVSVRIYDAAGRLVSTLVDGKETAGRHVVEWGGRDDRGYRVAAGVYFCKMSVGGTESVRKLVVVR